MRGTGAYRKRITYISVSVAAIVLMLFFDQLTKVLFSNLYEKSGSTVVIPNFFYFTYTENRGSAFGFLNGVSWAQTFFKILTVFAMVAFVAYLVYACKKERKMLVVALLMIISGTIGNFVDRLLFGYVRDFIGMTFGSYNFPIYNVADIFLTIGTILFIVYYCFFDDNAVFKKSDKENV